MLNPQVATELAPQPNYTARSLTTVAVASGKGGVGKTNISLNVSIALAHAGRKVLLMDADLGLANIDVLLGLHPKFNLAHVLDGKCTLDEAMLTGPGGIKLIPASSGLSHMAQLSESEHAGIIHLFSQLDTDIDTMLIDTGAGIADNVVTFCKAAQEVIIVVCDEPTSIADAYALIKVLRSNHDVRAFNIIVNMVKDRQHGLRVHAALAQVTDRFLDVDLRLLGCVPNDSYVRKAVRAQKAVLERHPLSAASLALRAIARRISDWEIPQSANGHLQFFVERLLQNANRSEPHDN